MVNPIRGIWKGSLWKGLFKNKRKIPIMGALGEDRLEDEQI